MNKYKKILSWMLLSSLLIWNIQVSLASNDTKPSADEVKKVETEIVTLQSNLFDNSKSVFEKLSSEFQKIANYEEKWNLSIDLKVDEDAFWKGNASLKLNNYTGKAAVFDSEVSGDLKVSADYTPVYGSGFELDLSTFASMISKDSEVYVLLKDLDFKVNNENISQVLTQLKEQFKDNKYLKFPTDEQSKAWLEMLKSFQAQSFLNQVDTKLQTPFFTTYKKVGNKYLLVPTKFACDTFFEVDQKLNMSKSWYTPQTCTEAVYKKVVSEFTKEGELYITLGDKENTLGYYLVDKMDKTIVDLQVKYNDTNITKVDFSVIPDQSKQKNEGFSLNYSKNEFLKANLYAEKWAYKMNFYSELDENNNFKEITSSINLNKDVVGSLTLKDKKLNSFVMIKQKGYDYDSEEWEYKLKNVFAMKVTGTMDASNNLSTLVAKFAWVDVKSKKAFLLGKMGYNSGNFTTYLKYEDTMGKMILNGKWQLEAKYFSYDATLDVNSIYKGTIWYEIDARDNKNNAKMNLIVNNGLKDVFSLKVLSEAKREHKSDLKVEAPKDYSTYTLPTSNYDDNYGDDYLDSFEEIE